MLFDPVKDDGLNNSRFYHHFGYWTGFSCETRTGTGGTTRVVLIGQVGPGAIGRPKNTGQMKTPGPIPIDASKRKNIDLYRK
jgi:hypothetical protein